MRWGTHDSMPILFGRSLAYESRCFKEIISLRSLIWAFLVWVLFSKMKIWTPALKHGMRPNQRLMSVSGWFFKAPLGLASRQPLLTSMMPTMTFIRCTSSGYQCMHEVYTSNTESRFFWHNAVLRQCLYWLFLFGESFNEFTYHWNLDLIHKTWAHLNDGQK